MRMRSTFTTFVVLMIILLQSVIGAQVFVIDGTGNAVATFSNTSSPYITWNQTVGGFGAAIFNSLATRNVNTTIQSASPRPLLGDNNVLSAEIYVTHTEIDGCSQGENRIRVVFRNPDGGAQDTQWAGTSGGEGGNGLQWFPSETNTWTTFNYDLTKESWWENDYSSWEIYRFLLYENDDKNYDNTFAIRNLKFTEASTSSTGTVLIIK